MARCHIKARFLAPGAALLWMTNPVLTQAVTYIVQRATSLATFFYLLSLFCYIMARNSQLRRPREKAAMLWFTACGVSLLAGLASKEITVLLPLFILIYEWYFFQNLNGRWLRQQSKWIGLLLLVPVVTAILYLHGNPAGTHLFTSDDKPFTLVQRSLTEPQVIIYYLSLIAFPHPARLNLDYDFPLSGSLSDPTTVLAIVALLCLAAAAVYAAGRHRLLSFAILWFLGNLIIESSSPGLEIIYEHRAYLPSIFPVIVFTYGLYHFIGDKRSTILLLLVMAVISGFWTFRRNAVWQDSMELWLDSARKSPGNARAFSHLGLVCARSGRNPLQAADYLNTALTLSRNRWGEGHPMTAIHYYNLAETYRINRNTDQAIKLYQQALTLLSQVDGPPHSSIAAIYNNLATMRKNAGDMDGAMDGYRKALEALSETPAPPGEQAINAAGIYNNMAVACAEQGDVAMAEKYLNEALRLLTDEFGDRHPLTRRVDKTLKELSRNRTAVIQ
jgi:Tfp pilus assembly protein PilF